MTSRDFCYWLQGFFEIHGKAELTPEQVEMVQRHLALVFVHEIDPSAGGAETQEKLNKLHEDLKKTGPKIGGVGPGGTVYRC